MSLPTARTLVIIVFVLLLNVAVLELFVLVDDAAHPEAASEFGWEA